MYYNVQNVYMSQSQGVKKESTVKILFNTSVKEDHIKGYSFAILLITLTIVFIFNDKFFKFISK